MWCRADPASLLSLLLLLSLCVAKGLKVTDFMVPRYADVGSTVVLKCDFTLGQGKLNSVKWYKDEAEFFRFIPDTQPGQPEILLFPQSGISLDQYRSGKNSVALKDLTYNSSGIYKCEVSTDSPDFKTDTMNGSLTVYAYPTRSPSVTGLNSLYLPGDIVLANCSAGPSHPPAQITWFVNGIKAYGSQLLPYPLQEEGEQLYSKVLGLRVELSESDFETRDATVALRCVVQVGELDATNIDNTVRRRRQTLRSSSVESSSQRFSNNDSSMTIASQSFAVWCLIISTFSPMWLLRLRHSHLHHQQNVHDRSL
ncbi:uncharacterized protein LOC111054108 [Nilaparvata lugens]|uniref:uncharacterized protein LOC111054108 n=1 Tax=Nilaparvata lugens TaxID=108931 RepID=UPI00193E3397|nr:uncharacterized protein LOC111054108 [Nilaparvata lugens]